MPFSPTTYPLSIGQKVANSYARLLRSLAVQQHFTYWLLSRNTLTLHTQGQDSLVRLRRTIAVHRRLPLLWV